MGDNLTATASITLNASPERVWKALTTPSEIKQYLFGTDTKSEWKKGSSITYTGEWEGKKYEDKGEIIEIVPNRLLHTTYLSNMSGKEDKPENYSNVIYRLEPTDAQTVLTITQDNNANEKSRDHSQANWNMVLQSLKKLVE
ncbi:MAG: SRPBCC domain-containing protein [Chitinophagaceae bacterium]|nr:SRPBCC domain-containing protein [Chitinophagaceae bacterium]